MIDEDNLGNFSVKIPSKSTQTFATVTWNETQYLMLNNVPRKLSQHTKLVVEF